jgi:hypothetical protein
MTDRICGRRTIILAQEGSDDLARLKASGASGIFILTDEGEMLICCGCKNARVDGE